MNVQPVFVFSFLLIATCRSFSQTAVDAELAFAKYAKDQSIKKAFLHYADSSAVVFANGKIANAMASWNAVPEISGLLEWAPALTCMSSSGDLAFNTGPFTFRPSAGDTISGSGHFNTIWLKNKNGEWKFLADLGADTRNTSLQTIEPRIIMGLTPDTSSRTIGTLEAELNMALAKSGNQTYTAFLRPDSWFNIDGLPALTSETAILAALDQLPETVKYTSVKSGLSIAKDLGYVYGYAEANGRKENFLRVWGHTANGWKILLQVLKS